MVKRVVANVLTLVSFNFLQACNPSHVLGTLTTSLDKSKLGSMIRQSRARPGRINSQNLQTLWLAEADNGLR